MPTFVNRPDLGLWQKPCPHEGHAQVMAHSGDWAVLPEQCVVRSIGEIDYSRKCGHAWLKATVSTY